MGSSGLQMCPRRNTAATNVRIADKLNMGAPQSVSMQTNRFRQ